MKNFDSKTSITFIRTVVSVLAISLLSAAVTAASVYNMPSITPSQNDQLAALQETSQSESSSIDIATQRVQREVHPKKSAGSTQSIDSVANEPLLTTVSLVDKAESQLFFESGLKQEDGKDFQNNFKTIHELRCLALNIYHEARGEPKQGQIAVGHVVMNRVAHSRFPTSVCGVVKQGGAQRLHRCQFSWWCDGRPDSPRNGAVWENSVQVAHEIYFGESKDPTHGALWYHAEYVRPYWRKVFEKGPKIGQHIFYLDRARPQSGVMT